MSSTTQPAERVASAPDDQPKPLTRWVPPNERPPTTAEETQARKQSLQTGNVTQIGIDSRTDSYHPGQLSSDQRARYQTLDSHNRDNHWKYRADIDVARDYDRQLKLKVTLALTSQLGLPARQRQNVIRRLFQLDLQRFGQRIDAVAFCLCAVVLNEESGRRGGDTSDRVYHPARSDRNNDSEFVRVKNQLLEAHGTITNKRLQSIYAKLTQADPPTKIDDRGQRLIRTDTQVQRHPSFPPEHTLPEPSGEK